MPKHSGRNLQKIAVAFFILFIFSLQIVSGAFASALDHVEVMSAPLTAKSSAANGMVRVYLSSLGNPSTLNLTIVGNYSVNGDTSQSISSGSSVTVGFSSSTGAITLTRNGVKTNMGTYFALRRHSASGTNGVKIAQARESGNLYPGDISFRAVASGGGYKLYTVAHIYIENYLYGVLPYEMGNSTNIEALKAQAVAARTYTVKQMQSRASGYFDVYDTTSDQVYRGTPSGNLNCVAAVDATKGIVLMYGSNYIITYYSASNGGQTEAVRTGGSYPYFTVKDDPFDFANPSSTVKSKTVYADLAGGSNNASLVNLLKSKAVTKLKSGGYNATSANTTLKTLKSVTPHTPMYASPSRLYTKMDFTMTASVGGSSTTVTVTCDIFSELESMLSMSIQSTKNELWSVTKSGGNFVLQARRFGHGMGMSQRGAMYMAKLGYTYDEILGFYYDGCKRVQHRFTNTILSVTGDTQTTVEDPADITGDDPAACKGTVKLIGSGATLAIRTGKSTSASLIGTAGNGAIVKVLANDGTWCFIQYGNLKGYVPANALSISGVPAGHEETPTAIAGFATVTASDFVNLRQSGSMSAAVVSTAPNGGVLTVFSTSGSWAYVQYCATVAYVNTGYISGVTTTYPSEVVSSGSSTATIATEDGTGTVNLRASASTDAQVLAQLPHGASVTVTADDGSWCAVTYSGQTGYVLSRYVSYNGDSLENNNGGSGGEGGDTPGGEPSGTAATVSAEIGYLREQPSADSSSKLLVAQGETVTVTERGEEWCAVSYAGETGYMLTSSLSFSSAGGTQTAVKAVVTTQSGSLNMRAEAKAGSRILTTIPRGAEIDVTSSGGTWCGVTYNGYAGYVMSSFLTFMQGGGATNPPAGGGGTAVVTTQSGSLNLRAEPRSGSAILRTIPQYATITVHERGAEWCHVAYQGSTGYVMTVFLTFPDEEPGDDPDGGGTTGPSEPGGEEPSGPDDPNGGGEPEVPDGGDHPDVNDPDEPIVPDPGDENTLYAVVTTVSGSLNLRRDPLPGSDVLARIPKGTTIVITKKLSAWSQTTFAGQTGYVMNAYLTFQQGRPDVSGGETAVVTTVSGSLNLRMEPSKGSGVVMRIPQYATVSVQQRGASWCYIGYNGAYGYVMTEFLTFSGNAPNPDAGTGGDAEGPGADTGAGTAYVTTVSGSLNLRAGASGGARVIRTIPRNAEVTVDVYGDTWCGVTYGGVSGYVMTQFLRFMPKSAEAETPLEETPPESQPTGEPGEEPDAQKEETPVTAWVLTASGSLNLRETPSGDARLLTVIPRLAPVSVLRDDGEWAYLRYGGYDGYAMTKYITYTDPGAQAGGENPSGGTQDSGTEAPETQPEREETSSGDGTDANPETGAQPEQPGGSSSGGIITEGGMSLDVTLEAPARATYALVVPAVGQETLALRSQCLDASEKLADMPASAEVEVILRGDTWCLVQYGERQGYCLTKYLSMRERE